MGTAIMALGAGQECSEEIPALVYSFSSKAATSWLLVGLW